MNQSDSARSLHSSAGRGDARMDGDGPYCRLKERRPAAVGKRGMAAAT